MITAASDKVQNERREPRARIYAEPTLSKTRREIGAARQRL